MQYQFPSYTIAYVISAILCFISAGIAWKRRTTPGTFPFALLMLSLTVWSFASVFEAGAMTVNEKVFWSQWQYLGITTVSPLWLIFTAAYTGKNKFLTNKHQRVIWVIPVATLFLAFTNELHHLIWTDISVSSDGLHIGQDSHGIAFYVYMIFCYACLFTGTLWLAKSSLAGEKNYRFRPMVFIAAVVFSWAANILYVFDLFPIPKLDITPLSFSLIALVMFWGIARNQLFDLMPIARKKLLDNMAEGVIVIDPNDIILEINPTAIKLTGYKEKQPLGQSVWDVFSDYGKVVEQFRHKTNLATEVEIPGDQHRVIDLQITSIDKEGENTSGQLIVLRDITKRKEAERIEKDQQDFAEALADTAAIINSSLDLNEVLDKILDNVAKVVPHESATIALVTDQGTAKFAAVKGSEKFGSMDSLLSLDLNVLNMKNFQRMSKSHKALIIADTHANSDWAHNIEESEWIRSYLGAPIVYQDKVLGFINLDAGTPNFFNPENAERLEIFTNYAATAIMNAKHYSETRIRAEEMAILYEISLAIAADVGLERTTLTVFQQLKKVLPIDLFFLALHEPTEKLVSFFMYQKDGERIEIEPFNLMWKPSLTRYVIEKRETIFISDFKAEDAEIKEDEIIRVPGFDNRTILGIPLIQRGEVIGVLSVQSAQPDAYDPVQIRLVETIAQQTSIAIDNAKLFEKMQKMAITDSLTGIYNRRYFYMILRNEIERAKRYQSPLSLVMMDIDHFKKVNDKFGHLAGDEVLQSVSEITKKLLRQIDKMFRFGGEEFMIILPETNQEGALKVANRIRSTIADTTIKTQKGDVRITTSIGVSEYGEEYPTKNEFIESADKILYDAKETGRNCVRALSR